MDVHTLFFTYSIICLSHFSEQESVQEIIRRFHLTPLEPEGGYFREIYNTGFDDSQNSICNVQHSRSHIYYLLKDETSEHRVSTWHKIIGTEETWYHHIGATITIFVITKQKENVMAFKTVHLGTSRGSTPFFTIPPNTWFAAMVNTSDTKAYSLVSCVCEPGFSYANFQIATHESICSDGILLQAWKTNPKLFEYFLPNIKLKNKIANCINNNEHLKF